MKVHCATHGTFTYCPSGTAGRCRLVGENLRKAEAIGEEGTHGFSVAEKQAFLSSYLYTQERRGCSRVKYGKIMVVKEETGALRQALGLLYF